MKASALVAAAALPALAAPAHAQLAIDWYTIDGGGTTVSTGGTYELAGTIGQPDAGPEMTGGSLALHPGFWPGVAVSCFADLAPPFGVLDFFDILTFLGLFDAMEPAADIAPPSGVWDFFDILTYLGLFDAGCP